MKKTTQQVFIGQPDEWKYAAVNKDGSVWLYKVKPSVSWSDPVRFVTNRIGRRLGLGYDATDWENSAIERDFSLHTISLNDDEIQIIVKGIMLLSDFDHITNIPLAETKALAFRFLPFLEDE